MNITKKELASKLLSSFQAGFSVCRKVYNDPLLQNKSQAELQEMIDNTIQVVIHSVLNDINDKDKN